MFYKYRKTKRDIFKCFFIILHVVFGLDFGYVKRNLPRSKILVKGITIIQCICISFSFLIVLVTSGEDVQVITWTTGLVFHNAYNAVVLALNAKKSLYTLQKLLSSIDTKLSTKLSYISNTKFKILVAWIVNIIYLLTSVYLVFSRCYAGCVRSKLVTMLSIHQFISHCTVLIMCFFSLYSVYCRLSFLVDLVKKCNNQVLVSLNAYKTIADAVDMIKKPYLELLYGAAIIIFLPNTMLFVYYALSTMKSIDGKISDYFITSLYYFQIIAVLFSTPVTAGLLTAKAKELAVILQDRLLQERNEGHALTLELFAAYVSARPLRLRVLHVVSLDWTLPVLFLDLSISYQIVLVQITHLY